MKKGLRTMPTLLLLLLCAISVFTTFYLFFEVRNYYAAAKQYQEQASIAQHNLEVVIKEKTDLEGQINTLTEDVDYLNTKVEDQRLVINQLNKELKAAKQKPVVMPVPKPTPPPKKKKKRIPYDISPSQQ
jgi:peptidoglycan hydrolase CwlO-like protein